MKGMRACFAFTLIFIITILVINITYAQSLADIAKKEKERREKIKTPAKVITNETVQEHLQGKGNPPGTIMQPSEEGAESDTTSIPTIATQEESTKSEKASSEPTDMEGNNESYWRSKIQDAKERITNMEKQVDDLQLRLNSLQMSFYAMDDPNQRQLLNVEIDKTFEMLAKAKDDLQKAKQDLEDIKEEGRRKGALPGWIYN